MCEKVFIVISVNVIINVKLNYMIIKKKVYFVFFFLRFNFLNCDK